MAEWIMNGTVGSSSTSLIMPVFTTAFQMNPVLVSWALTVPRLVDAFVDPYIGHWSDQTRSRWGRRKPFLFAGALLSAFFSMAIWWASPSWGMNAQFAYLMAVSVVFSLSYALYTIPSNGLAFEASGDYHERVRVMTARSIYCTVPGLVIGWVYWLALRPFWGGEIAGVRWVSVLVAVAIILCGCAPLLMVKERFAHRTDPRQPIAKALKEAACNRHFLHFMALVIVMALASAIYNGLTFYVNVYYVCAGDKAQAVKIAAITSTLSTVCALIFAPFAPMLGKRFGKRCGLSLGCGLMCLHAVLQPLLLNPRHPYLQISGALLYAPALAYYGTFLGSFLADICDLDDVRSGHRREGLYGAVYAFVKKIEISLCALLTGYLVTLSGFSATLAQQGEATVTMLKWFTFTPYIVLTVGAFWLAATFPITRQMAENARRILEDRNKRKAA